MSETEARKQFELLYRHELFAAWLWNHHNAVARYVITHQNYTVPVRRFAEHGDFIECWNKIVAGASLPELDPEFTPDAPRATVEGNATQTRPVPSRMVVRKRHKPR